MALMALAIVMSPIPSGPIAMAAGASFGPFLGTVYTVIGAETGAVVAFLIARSLGYEAVQRWAGARPWLEWLNRRRSQHWLMAVVFASRLMPFISFDVVSYAAGLTPLALWRFALATFVGVVPISFVLAYLGERFVSTEPRTMIFLALLLGGLTLVPFGYRFLRNRMRRG